MSEIREAIGVGMITLPLAARRAAEFAGYAIEWLVFVMLALLVGVGLLTVVVVILAWDLWPFTL